jgi:hypothetical protein
MMETPPRPSTWIVAAALKEAAAETGSAIVFDREIQETTSLSARSLYLAYGELSASGAISTSRRSGGERTVRILAHPFWAHLESLSLAFRAGAAVEVAK